MERLLEILSTIRPDVDFINEQNLIEDGVLDSLDIVSIISELMDEYDIAIKVSELSPENFNSIGAISKMIERLRAK